MTDNYKILINKLDAFIRKYYKNQIIRGIIYSVAALLLFFVTVALLEYFAHFGTAIRTVIFYFYLAISLIIVFRLIIFPLSKLPEQYRWIMLANPMTSIIEIIMSHDAYAVNGIRSCRDACVLRAYATRPRVRRRSLFVAW